jgi:hypothetical protein
MSQPALAPRLLVDVGLCFRRLEPLAERMQVALAVGAAVDPATDITLPFQAPQKLQHQRLHVVSERIDLLRRSCELESARLEKLNAIHPSHTAAEEWVVTFSITYFEILVW